MWMDTNICEIYPDIKRLLWENSLSRKRKIGGCKYKNVTIHLPGHHTRVVKIVRYE